jgi:hypothetical protein
MFGQAAIFLAYGVLHVAHGIPLLEIIMPEVQNSTFRFSQEVLAYSLLASTWLVLGFVSIIVGVSLRRGAAWGWTAAIILQGAILLLALEAYFTANANATFYLAMILASAIVFVLNQRQVLTFYRAHKVTLLD